jgi:hypothetical protein
MVKQIYWLPDLLFSDQFVALAVSQVPDVVLWDLVFLRKSARSQHRSHLLDEMRVEFRNGRSITIDGPYLWKFRDSIPPEFGSDEGGYLDCNPFCEGSLEGLLTNLRAAHDRFFIPMPEGEAPAPPLSVQIDTRIERISTTTPYSVPAAVQLALSERLERHFDRLRPTCEPMIADTLRGLLEHGRSRFRMEPDPDHPALLRNTLKTEPWPEDVYARSLSDMLTELNPGLDDPHGPTPKLHDRLRDWLEPRAEAWFKRFARRNDDLCYALRTALGWSGVGVVPPDELLRTFRDCECPDLPEEVLWRSLLSRYGDKTVGELIAYGGPARRDSAHRAADVKRAPSSRLRRRMH